MLPVSDAFRAALTSAAPVWDFGADLLDSDDRVVEDISGDVLSLSVERDTYADVHGSCTLSLTRDLRWGVDRVRPWFAVWDGHSHIEVERVERGAVTATNLITNPSFATLNDWSGSRLDITHDTTRSRYGISSAHIATPDVDEGANYFIHGGVYGWTAPSAHVRLSVLTEGAAQVRLAIYCYAADGTNLGPVTAPDVDVDSADGWVNLSGVLEVPAGTDRVRLTLFLNDGSDPVWVDGAILSTTPVPYFDGDTPDTATVEYAWTGEPHASTSVQRRVTRWTETEPVWHRWNLGVFLLTSPEEAAGESPRTRQVSGVDKLWLLQRSIGDTYVVPAGMSYLDAIRGVLADAGVTGRLLLDGDRQATTLDGPAVWVLTEDGGYSWLEVVNGLLSMIGYGHLWVDERGRFRSEPSRPASERGSVWTFDTTDVLKGIVGEDRTLSADVYDQPNLWRFVRRKDRDLTTDDVYTVDRTEGLAAEQVRRRVVFLDVADRAALVSEGDRLVAEDTQDERVVSFTASALPLTHADVVTVRDPDLGLSTRALVRRWSITDDGSMDVEAEVL